MVSLSAVLVTCDPTSSENMKWKIPETKNSCGLNRAPLKLKSRAPQAEISRHSLRPAPCPASPCCACSLPSCQSLGGRLRDRIDWRGITAPVFGAPWVFLVTAPKCRTSDAKEKTRSARRRRSRGQRQPRAASRRSRGPPRSSRHVPLTSPRIVPGRRASTAQWEALGERPRPHNSYCIYYLFSLFD